MADLWPEVTLSEVVTLQRGHDLPAQKRVSGDVPVIGSGGVGGWHNEAKAQGPGVVLGRATNLGVPQWCSGAYWPLNTTLYVTDFRGNDPRFIFHLFESLDLSGFDSGSVQPMLNRNYIAKVPVLLPPLAEQRRIAGVLGALDDLIEVNRGLMAAIEDLLAARFSEFGFDEPGDSRLVELIQVNPTRSKPKGEAAYIEMAALSETQAGIDRVARRPATGGARFINGDTLMARITPCLENGKIGFVDCLADGEVGVGSTEFIVLRSEPPYPLGWTYLLARSPRFRDHVVRHMTGTSGRQRCPADAVTEYRLRSPEQTQLKAFADLANPLFEALRDLRIENEELNKTRVELLPLLMSGRVRVTEEVAA